jgi:hypothetical protein
MLELTRKVVLLLAISLLLVATIPLAADQPVPADAAPPVEPPGSAGEDEEPKPRMEIYGHVMTDAGYNDGQIHPDWYDVMRPTKLPAYENEFGEDGETFFSVRQTRFGVKSWTPVGDKEIYGIFEFELFGTGSDAGQTTFRLRHAYLEYEQFGAGQYWSPFMDIDVFPNSLEYWGPSGMVFFRNIQLRWMPIKGETRLTIAIERPGASGDRGTFEDRVELDDVTGRFPYPDLSAEYRLGGKWGYVELAGMLRSIKWDDNGTDEYDLSGSATGWGLNLSSNIKFGEGSTVRLQVVYGEGIENYMNDATADIGIVPNPGDPVRPVRGETLPLLGIVAFLDQAWSPKLSTAVGFSLIDIDNSEGQSDDAFASGRYALANLLHNPVKNLLYGVELQYGYRENYLDGWDTDAWRVQVSAKYNFSFAFGG